MPEIKRRNFDCIESSCFKVVEGVPCISRSFGSVLFGVCDKTFWQWHKEGLPSVMLGKKRWYPIYGCLDWYLDNIYERKGNSDTTSRKDDAEVRKKIAEAEITELKLAKEKGNLINVDDIAKQLALRGTYFKSALDELPRSNASEMMSCETEKEVINFWTELNNGVLEKFAQKLEIKMKDDFSKNLRVIDEKEE